MAKIVENSCRDYNFRNAHNFETCPRARNSKLIMCYWIVDIINYNHTAVISSSFGTVINAYCYSISVIFNIKCQYNKKKIVCISIFDICVKTILYSYWIDLLFVILTTVIIIQIIRYNIGKWMSPEYIIGIPNNMYAPK